MTELLALAQTLSGVGFPTLMVAILYGSYKGWWIWGRTCTDMQADFEKRLAKAEQISDRWQALALRATSLTEDTVGIAIKKAAEGP